MWRLSVVIPWAFLFGIFITGAILAPHQAIAALTAPLLIGLISWAAVRRVRLDVTETVVRAIHYLPRVISFRGPSGESIMMIRAEYTKRQMLKGRRGA